MYSGAGRKQKMMMKKGGKRGKGIHRQTNRRTDVGSEKQRKLRS